MPTFDVTVTSLTYGGEAVGRLPDGRAVFVPYALPGEQVRVQLVENKRTFARAELVAVLQPSPERIAARCPHFGRCGGCHYQHIPYPRQLEIKTAILREQLERLGKLHNPPVQPMTPAPHEWNYRSALQFHLTETGKLGFQAAGSHRVVPITVCYLPETAIAETWPLLDFESIPNLERVELRQGAGEELMLILESSSLETPDLTIELPISVAHLSPGGLLILAGEKALLMEVRGRTFQLSPDSFFQVNTAVAELMIAHVIDLLALQPDQTVLDVYCGVGLFTAFLAGQVKRCVGVELSESACNDFAANLDEFDNVELYVGPAGEILPELDLHPQAVLVDPPRAGVERPALNALIAMAAPRLVYVSCDPSTLARDASLLVQAGYRLEQVTPFDMFPHTYHIESVSLFVKD